MVRAFRHVWFAGMYEFDLVLLLLQQMCVFLVIAWLMSKTRLFIPLMQVTVRLPHKLLCYVTFSIFCIMGTDFGLHIEDSIANARAIGEFGAVSVVSGSIRGETLSLPLQIELLEQDYNTVGSFTAAALLTLMAILTLFLKSMLQWRLANQKERAQQEGNHEH